MINVDFYSSNKIASTVTLNISESVPEPEIIFYIYPYKMVLEIGTEVNEVFPSKYNKVYNAYVKEIRKF